MFAGLLLKSFPQASCIIYDDFLNVQNYTRTQYNENGQMPCPAGAELTQMDYDFYPEALEHVIRKVHEEF